MNNDSFDKLTEACAKLTETQKIADDTMMHLGKQREQLDKIRAGNKDTQSELGRSQGFITKLRKWWRR